LVANRQHLFGVRRILNVFEFWQQMIVHVW
jgi:hypothetical protein